MILITFGTDHVEEEEARARKEAAEGQTTKSLQTHGNIHLPSKQRETRKCGGTLGSGASGKRTSTRRRKMACIRRRHRPAPRELKN
jgi:hypothetical protein